MKTDIKLESGGEGGKNLKTLTKRHFFFTFFNTLSSAGVLGVPDVVEGVPLFPERGVPLLPDTGVLLELGVEKVPFRTPRGVLGGEVIQGLHSENTLV